MSFPQMTDTSAELIENKFRKTSLKGAQRPTLQYYTEQIAAFITKKINT